MKSIKFFFLLFDYFQFLEVKFSIYLNRHVFVMLVTGDWSQSREMDTLSETANV